MCFINSGVFTPISLIMNWRDTFNFHLMNRVPENPEIRRDFEYKIYFGKVACGKTISYFSLFHAPGILCSIFVANDTSEPTTIPYRIATAPSQTLTARGPPPQADWFLTFTQLSSIEVIK